MLRRILVLTFAVLQLWQASASPVDRVFIVKRDAPSVVELENFDKPAQNEQEKKIKPPKIYSMLIESDISLRYSTTRVTSRVANPADSAQETTFHVVLPETAFISGFLMEIDGKVYKATVKEKEKAQAEYQSAVSAGQSAAQVATSARDSNQFTVSINIEAGAKMSFNLTYEELLTRRRGIYEQSIHVNPGSVVPDMRVKVSIAEVLPITTIKVPKLRSNEIQESDDDGDNQDADIVRHNETAVSVVYEPTEAQQASFSRDGLQGQFIVQYDVDRSSVNRLGGEIHVVDGYFVHFFAPSSLPALPKHVVFVLDTSGSMHGTKLEQTKQAMYSILDQLRPEDVFSVVEFSSDVKEWDLTKPYEPPEQPYWKYVNTEKPAESQPTVVKEEPKALKRNYGPYDDILAYTVTEESVIRAKEFVDQMEATGSTNINGAVLKALANTQSLQSKIRLTPMIIFLTDGEATVGETNNEAILTNLRKANSDGVVSIFSLAFGTGADFNFLTKVSGQNKGFARKIYEAADATLQLKGFFREVASPLLKNVRFVYEGGNKVTDVTKTKVPNYFLGTELVVAGRVQDQAALTGSINATSAEGAFFNDFICVIPPIPVPEDDEDPGDDPLAVDPEKKKPSKKKVTKFSLEKIWAYITIQDLLKQRDNEIDDVDEDEDEKEDVEKKALKLSLSYGFVTPLTSLVVVKPGDTATPADLRPADGTSGLAADSYTASSPQFASLSTGLGFAGPPGLTAYPLAAYAPAAAPPYPLTTTVFYKPVAELQEESPDYAVFESAIIPEPSSTDSPTIDGEEAVAEGTADVLRQLKWIGRFEHNDTYAKIPQGNDTLILSWRDELDDLQFDPCSVTYKSNNTVPGFCKPLWKCSTIQLDAFSPDTSDVCVINNKYVGVCCVPALEPVPPFYSSPAGADTNIPA